MDPQQRILLELVWHAAEDAGIPASKLAGSATGVYIGGSSTDYRDLRLGDPASGDSYFMTGGTLSILANRISYVFDLHGPSLTVDTACSSSLVALHHACEAIRDGRIETRDRRRHQPAAVALPVSRLLPRLDAVAPRPLLRLRRARRRLCARRRRRRHHPEAAGAGARRRRPHPRRDPRHRRQLRRPHDRLVAAERGGADRADPHGLRSAPASAPDDLAFFEMHGTGTPAGDPIEAAAVGRALGQGRARTAADRLGEDQYRPSGAGLRHGRADQGGAGAGSRHRAADAALRSAQPGHPVRRRSICGSCGSAEAIADGRLRRRQLVRLRRHQRPCGAGRAAAARDGESCAGGSDGLPPLVISARTEASLRELAQTLARHARRGAAGACRLPCCAASRAGATSTRSASSRSAPTGPKPSPRSPISPPGPITPAVITGTAVREGKLAFVFAGNGAQWAGMGRDA